MGGTVRILLLCEGDAETRNSWSGTSLSVVRHLRALDHDVRCEDADLYGADRALALVRSIARPRRRWWVKYHLDGLPFALRSRRARRLYEQRESSTDAVLQFGATFDLGERLRRPLYLYCDGNIALSAHARVSGQSEAAFLSDREIRETRERERLVYDRATMIFCISERVRRSFIEDFGLDARKVRTVFAGPNTEIEHCMRVPRSVAAAGPPTVLFVGRQFVRKGGDLLLRAFRVVRSRVPDARLVIVGPRSLEVRDSGVHVEGFIDKDTPEGQARLNAIYEQASCFCMPSRFEGLSISFIEAMAYGLPCIGVGTDWAYPETIAHGETGLVVPMDDEAALADAMIELLQDRARSVRFGAAGRERVQRHFTWPRVVGLIHAGMREPLP
jgi:alpha-maltose-1-phosphate synthase